MTSDEARKAGFKASLERRDLLPPGLSVDEKRWYREGMADHRRFERLYEDHYSRVIHTAMSLGWKPRDW